MPLSEARASRARCPAHAGRAGAARAAQLGPGLRWEKRARGGDGVSGLVGAGFAIIGAAGAGRRLVPCERAPAFCLSSCYCWHSSRSAFTRAISHDPSATALCVRRRIKRLSSPPGRPTFRPGLPRLPLARLPRGVSRRRLGSEMPAELLPLQTRFPEGRPSRGGLEVGLRCGLHRRGRTRPRSGAFRTVKQIRRGEWHVEVFSEPSRRPGRDRGTG